MHTPSSLGVSQAFLAVALVHSGISGGKMSVMVGPHIVSLIGVSLVLAQRELIDLWLIQTLPLSSRLESLMYRM